MTSFARPKPLFSVVVALSPAASFAVFGNPSFVDPAVYSSVGELGQVGASGNFSFTASAVAIDPFWILTARHIDGNAVRLNGEIFHAVEDIASDDFDLRLIRVDHAITNYAKLAQFDAVGKQATLVGFGGTGIGTSGNAYNVGPPDGLRHTAVNMIDGIDQISFTDDQTPWYAYHYDLDDPNGNGGYIVGEGGVWSGDSGGGWFVNTAEGAQLIAISSAVTNPAFPDGGHENEFGSLGYGTRLPDAMGFIGQHVPNAVPEPATIAALGLGFLAACRKRRSKAA